MSLSHLFFIYILLLRINLLKKKRKKVLMKNYFNLSLIAAYAFIVAVGIKSGGLIGMSLLYAASYTLIGIVLALVVSGLIMCILLVFFRDSLEKINRCLKIVDCIFGLLVIISVTLLILSYSYYAVISIVACGTIMIISLHLRKIFNS